MRTRSGKTYTYKPYVRKPRAKAVVSKPIKAYVAKAIKEEKQLNWALIDNTLQEINYDTTFMPHWSSIAQGDSINQREGDRIEPTLLTMKFQVSHTFSFDVSRVILFQWKPDTAVDAPDMSKILEIPSTAQSVYSPYVQMKVKRDKFKVLKDMTFSNTQGTAGQNFTRTVNIKKFMSKYINYNTAPATSGKNLIFCLALSNAQVASAGPTFNKVVYLQWKDSA